MNCTTKSLLIIATHSTTRRALEIIFRRRGWEISTAETASEGFDLLHLEPTYILIDLVSSKCEGETIVDRVKALGLSSRIVVISGYEQPAASDDNQEESPYAFLSKPINVTTLLSLFANWNFARQKTRSSSRKTELPSLRQVTPVTHLPTSCLVPLIQSDESIAPVVH